MDDGWLPSENQRRIVALYAEGYGRWKIAEILDVNEASVRKSVGFLCVRFGCPIRELPARLAAFDAEREEFSFLDPPPEETVTDDDDDEDDDGRVTV
jgi:hypothetical protein